MKEKISPDLLTCLIHISFLAYLLHFFLLIYFLMLREIKEKMVAILKILANARPKSKHLNLSCAEETQQELLSCEEHQATQSNF